MKSLVPHLAASQKQRNGQNAGLYGCDSSHSGCKDTNKFVFVRFSGVKFCRLGISSYLCRRNRILGYVQKICYHRKFLDAADAPEGVGGITSGYL